MDEKVIYEMRVGFEGPSPSWWEIIDGIETRTHAKRKPTCDEEAVEQAKKIIENFNETLKPCEERRELKEVKKTMVLKEYTSLPF